MHPTDHLTDVQLNEYLDNESTEPMQIEAHLAECADCAARLTALQSLFAEIESLPELTLSRDLREASQWDATPFTPPVSLPVPQLPRWFTLTATLQAAFALIAIIFAAPVISRYFASVLQTYPIPSLNDWVIGLQVYLVMWMQSVQSIQSFQVPAIPTELFTLPKELSATTLSVSVIGIFSVWLIGNWWLLRKRPNSLA